MSGAHTPGPWGFTWSEGPTEIEIFDGTADMPGCEELYIYVLGASLICSEANARLIAAAPDLLAALEEAKEELAYFVEFARQQCEFSGDIEAGYSAIRKCLAAIAKARGQGPA